MATVVLVPTTDLIVKAKLWKLFLQCSSSSHDLTCLLCSSVRGKDARPNQTQLQKSFREQELIANINLRSVYLQSLVSMTLAGLGCFGSHNSWQVVSCVAGPEADRDGPSLSAARQGSHPSILGLRRVPSGGHTRPLFTMLTRDSKPAPKLPNLLGWC